MTPNSRLKLTPMSEHTGADITGVSIDEIVDDEALFADIQRAMNRHIVLRFGGQEISPASITAFMRRFGPPMDIRAPGKGAVHVPGHDFIQVLSGASDETGRPLGDDNTSQQIWHTDAGQWEVPPGVVFLYGRVIPKQAPKTYFKNMIKVYEALPEDLKQTIASLRAIHHMYPRSVDVEVHRNGQTLAREIRENGPAQPLVRRHLPTAKPMLYLPTRRDSVIPGLSDMQSKALLTRLWDIAEASPFDIVCPIGVGDLIAWDNAAAVHSRDGWSGEIRRDVWHLLAEGESPTPMHPRKTTNANVPGQPAPAY